MRSEAWLALVLVVGCRTDRPVRAESGAFTRAGSAQQHAAAKTDPPQVVAVAECVDEPEGCVRDAVRLTRTDLPRAARLFEGACSAGSAAGCGNLAVMLRDGRGIPTDTARARELARFACRAGNERSCDDLLTMR